MVGAMNKRGVCSHTFNLVKNNYTRKKEQNMFQKESSRKDPRGNLVEKKKKEKNL